MQHQYSSWIMGCLNFVGTLDKLYVMPVNEVLCRQVNFELWAKVR